MCQPATMGQARHAQILVEHTANPVAEPNGQVLRGRGSPSRPGRPVRHTVELSMHLV